MCFSKLFATLHIVLKHSSARITKDTALCLKVTVIHRICFYYLLVTQGTTISTLYWVLTFIFLHTAMPNFDLQQICWYNILQWEFHQLSTASSCNVTMYNYKRTQDFTSIESIFENARAVRINNSPKSSSLHSEFRRLKKKAT